MPRERRRVRLLPPKLLPWQEEAIRRTMDIERRGGLTSSPLRLGQGRGRWKEEREKGIWETFETPSILEIIFAPIDGPLFPKEFSNSTPWAPPRH